MEWPAHLRQACRPLLATDVNTGPGCRPLSGLTTFVASIPAWVCQLSSGLSTFVRSVNVHWFRQPHQCTLTGRSVFGRRPAACPQTQWPRVRSRSLAHSSVASAVHIHLVNVSHCFTQAGRERSIVPSMAGHLCSQRAVQRGASSISQASVVYERQCCANSLHFRCKYTYMPMYR